MNNTCLFAHYSYTVWDTVVQVVPMVQSEAHAILSQAIADGRDAAEFTI